MEPCATISPKPSANSAPATAWRRHGSLAPRVGCSASSASSALASLWCASLHARLLLLSRLIRPGHAGGVVGDADVALRVEDDDAAVAVQSLLQIVHRFLRGPFGEIAGLNAVGGPLGQH